MVVGALALWSAVCSGKVRVLIPAGVFEACLGVDFVASAAAGLAADFGTEVFLDVVFAAGRGLDLGAALALEELVGEPKL